jgi:hypothetical protein
MTMQTQYQNPTPTTAQNGFSALPNVSDIISLTARLAQVLAEEADLLSAGDIKKVGELQKEKLLLTSALEREKKMIARNPEALQHVSAEDKQDLLSVMEIFNAILAENYRRMLVARDVNSFVVDAIGEVVNEATANSVYDKKARPDHVAREQLSVTLDEKA